MNYSKFIRDLPSIMQLGLRTEIFEDTIAKLEDKITKLENQLQSVKCDCHKLKDVDLSDEKCKDNGKIDFTSNACPPPPPPPPPPPIIVENFKFAKSSTPIFLGNGKSQSKIKSNTHPERKPDVIPTDDEQFLKRKKQKYIYLKLWRKLLCLSNNVYLFSSPLKATTQRRFDRTKEVASQDNLVSICQKVYYFRFYFVH